MVLNYLRQNRLSGCSKYFDYKLLFDNPDMLKLRPIQLIVNLACVVILMIILFIFEKIIPPFHRGFFCDDRSIMKPYIKNQTIPVWLLLSTSIISVLLVVVGNEFFKKDRLVLCKEQINHVYVGTIKLKLWIYRTLTQLSLALTGLLMNMLFTDIGKKLIGRLRPHFLSVCQPNFNKFNCSDGFITADVCTTLNAKSLTEARLSFPSGHSSASAFVSVFLALYIEMAIPYQRFYLVKPTIQFLLISLGISCGFTRISDYWHHWSDVLVGLGIGTFFALFTIFGLMKLNKFNKETNDRKREKDPPVDIENQQPSRSSDVQIGYSNTLDI